MSAADDELKAAGGASDDAAAAHRAAVGKSGGEQTDQKGFPSGESNSTSGASTEAAGGSSTTGIATGSDAGSKSAGTAAAAIPVTKVAMKINPVAKAMAYLPGGRKAAVIGLIALILTGATIAVIGLLMLWLSALKLDFFDKNLERRYLARLVHVFDTRSDRFVKTLVMAEIAGQDAGGANRYFIAKGVNSADKLSPLARQAQYYKDMKVNGFFDKLDKEHNIRFARVTSGVGRDKLAVIYTQGLSSTVDLNGLLTADGGLDPSKIDDFERRVIETYDRDPKARAVINQVLKDQTRWYQVVKRHYMRKWMFEKLGIRKWRFFEGTRENAAEKVRGKWDKAVAARYNDGSFFRCLTKNQCPTSTDINDNPYDPDSARSGEFADPDGADQDSAADEAGDRAGPADNKPGLTKRGFRFVGKSVARVVPILDIIYLPELLDMMVSLKKAIADGGIFKMMRLLKTTEYATAYSTFSILKDQLKNGDNVSPEEVSAAMDLYNGAEQSDGYKDFVGDGTKKPLAFTPSAYAASEEAGSKPVDPNNSPYAEVDEDFEIDNSQSLAVYEDGKNGEPKVETDAKGNDLGPAKAVAHGGWSVFSLMNPIGQVTSGWEDMPDRAKSLLRLPLKGVDWLFGKIIDGASFILGPILGPIASGIGTIGGKLGVDDAAKDVAGYVGSLLKKFAYAIGFYPRCTSDQPPGQQSNCLGAGATVVQQQFLGSLDGKKMSQAEVKEQDDAIAMAQQEEREFKSPWQRLASLDDPDSVLARVIMRTPSTESQLAAVPGSVIRTFASILNPINLMSSNMLALASPTASADVLSCPTIYKEGDCVGFTEKQLNDLDLFEGEMAKVDDAYATSSLCLPTNGKSKYYAPDKNICGIDTETQQVCSEEGLASGELADLAQQVLDEKNINLEQLAPDSGRLVKKDIELAAEGKESTSGKKLDVRILQLMLAMAKDHKFHVSAIESGGTGHSPNSDHYTGSAFDIDIFDGVGQAGSGDTPGKVMDVLNQVAPDMRISLGMDPVIAGKGNITPFKDRSNHVHIAVKGEGDSGDDTATTPDSGSPSDCNSGGGSGDLDAITGSRAELAERLLKNPNLKLQNPGVQKPDIQKSKVDGGVEDNLVKFMIAIVEQGNFSIPVTSVRSDHHVDGGGDPKGHGHNPAGAAIDIGFAGGSDEGNKLYKWLYDNRKGLNISQMIFKYPPQGQDACVYDGNPVGCNDVYRNDINDHADHIHVSVKFPGDNNGGK